MESNLALGLLDSAPLFRQLDRPPLVRVTVMVACACAVTVRCAFPTSPRRPLPGVPDALVLSADLSACSRRRPLQAVVVCAVLQACVP